ncbi:hypothetical protein H4R24_000201 [Coemansia sp. RSA 988]|nr:hypothetical protein H4R24_000201 [Coemansia sp. RSA 988]
MNYFILRLGFEEECSKEAQKTMIPAILNNAIKAISERDYTFLEQLMTLDLSKFYSYALANMAESRYQIRISASNIHNTKMKGLRHLGGPPMAFDASISPQQRLSKFKFNFTPISVMAIRRDADTPSKIKATRSSNGSGFEIWFSVRATIDISLSLNGKVIDKDKGEMTVPLSLSTPHYPTSYWLSHVGRDKVPESPRKGMEPFRWCLTDTFSIKTSNDLKSLIKLAKQEE